MPRSWQWFYISFTSLIGLKSVNLQGPLTFRIKVMYALLVSFGILLSLKNSKTSQNISSPIIGHAFLYKLKSNPSGPVALDPLQLHVTIGFPPMSLPSLTKNKKNIINSLKPYTSMYGLGLKLLLNRLLWRFAALDSIPNESKNLVSITTI